MDFSQGGRACPCATRQSGKTRRKHGTKSLSVFQCKVSDCHDAIQSMCACVCVRACLNVVRACVRACVRAYVRACVRAHLPFACLRVCVCVCVCWE